MHLELSWILLVATAASAFPQLGLQNSQEPQFARILSLQNDADASGAFSYSYETENGIKAEARGTLNNAGVADAEEQVVTGSFSFVADDGHLYTVTYIADSNGFRAFGDHLPPTPYSVETRQTVPTSSKAHAPANNLVSPPRVPAPAPQPVRTEQDDLARWQSRSDIRGLTPPPPPLLTDDTYAAGLVIFPAGRNPRTRQQEFYETIVY